MIGQGRLIYQGPVGGFVEGSAKRWVTVRSPQLEALAIALREQGAEVVPVKGGSIDVVGPDAAAIGDLAASLGATLHELSPRQASLEDVFIEATADAQQYRGSEEGS